MSSEKAMIRASATLDDIMALRRVPAFERYFLRRMRERADELQVKILSGDTQPDELAVHVRLYRQVMDLIEMIDTDEKVARKTLNPA